MIGAKADGATPEDVLRAEYGPLCEAMYLMMSADGEVTKEEREVLRGAMKNLSGDKLDGELVEAMLERATAQEKSDGREARMAEVTATLSKDTGRAEVAFVLAAAIAFADNTIADEENDALDRLAEGLGIDEARADVLLDAIEKDLGS